MALASFRRRLESSGIVITVKVISRENWNMPVIIFLFILVIYIILDAINGQTKGLFVLVGVILIFVIMSMIGSNL